MIEKRKEKLDFIQANNVSPNMHFINATHKNHQVK